MGAVVNNLEKGGGETKGVGMFFKEVVQAVLLFGSDMWVMTPRTGGAIGGSQHRVAICITGMYPLRVSGWKLVVPTFGDGDAGVRV